MKNIDFSMKYCNLKEKYPKHISQNKILLREDFPNSCRKDFLNFLEKYPNFIIEGTYEVEDDILFVIGLEIHGKENINEQMILDFKKFSTYPGYDVCGLIVNSRKLFMFPS